MSRGLITDDLDDALDVVDLEFVLDREAIDYKITHGSRGEQLNLRECPFCGGDSWKVYASRETGLGNCFHGDCGRTFNKFAFVRQMLGGSGKMAADYFRNLSRELGFRPKRKAAIKPVEIPKEIRLPDSFALPTPDGRNLSYLEDRGFDADLVAEFHLRLCVDGWYNFTKSDGSRGGMNFSNRVIIPIFDLDGKLVTFQGRDLTGDSDRKYIFPPGLPGTARFIYNGHNAYGVERIVIGEGAFDVMAITRAIAGHPEHAGMVAVGTFGKHLSSGDTGGDDQLGRFLRLKKQGASKVWFMWDGEKAALKDALKGAKLLTSHGFECWVCLLPAGKDPNEIEPSELNAAIKNAVMVTPTSAIQLALGKHYG